MDLNDPSTFLGKTESFEIVPVDLLEKPRLLADEYRQTREEVLMALDLVGRLHRPVLAAAETPGISQSDGRDPVM
jgi:hypothetical protein